MNPLKLCLVGCDRVAKSHMQGALRAESGVQVVCTVNRGREKGEAFAREFGIPGFYTSLEEAIKHEDFQAVDLCLPNHLHAAYAIQSLEAGKHVLVEKPMANTVAECEAMNRAAEKAGKLLMVGQSRRFFDSVFASRELAAKKTDGELLSIDAELQGYLPAAPTPWWNSVEKAGGLMIPIWGSHIIDHALWLFDGAPERVYCEALRVNPSWEGEDEVAMILGYSGGRFASIRMTWNLRTDGGGWDGAGKVLSSKDIFYRRILQFEKATWVLDDETSLSRNGQVMVQDEASGDNFARQLQEFATAIAENRRPLCDGRDIVDVIRVQEAALESARDHKLIHL